MVINKPKTDADKTIGLFFQFAVYSLSAVCTKSIKPATVLRVRRNAPLEKLIMGRKANNAITERIINERTYETTFWGFMLLFLFKDITLASMNTASQTFCKAVSEAFLHETLDERLSGTIPL
jgi:hypothetical protein